MVVLVVVVVVGAGILGGLFYYWYEPGHWLNPYRVNVSELTWTQGGNVIKTQVGFNVVAGTYLATSLPLVCSPSNGQSQTCQSGTLSIPTPGFRLTYTNTPFSWSSTSTSGTTMSVVVNFQTPTSAYSGNMTIALS